MSTDLDWRVTIYAPGGVAPASSTRSRLRGRVQVVSVPWSCTTTWRMPIATWRDLMRRHFPGRSWVALQEDTVERLARYRRDHGLHSFDACVERMLERDEAEPVDE